MARHGWHLLLILLAADVATGATITVRKDGTGDHSVIQQALDAAAAGDTILIGPGEYLEHSAVRLPGWSWDIESYAHVTMDDVTIIGAGSDQTFIGPAAYSGNYGLASPEAISHTEGGNVRIADVCIRNCYSGLAILGMLFVDGCALSNNAVGVSWHAVGSGGWIRETQFDAVTPNDPIALVVADGGAGSNILIEDSQFEHSTTIVQGVNGLTFRRCDFANATTALQIYFAAHAHLEDCTMTNMGVLGVELTLGSGAVCEILRSEFNGNQAALGVHQSGGRTIVEGSRFEGSTNAILRAEEGPGPCSIHNCDLIKGSGSVVVCGSYEPAVTHDLRNNYWGTTSESDIQSWIIDSNDDPNIHATVLYSPFAGQSVPSETTTWGDLKAQYR